MDYSKTCPDCGREQSYSHPNDLRKAQMANRLCRSCAAKLVLRNLDDHSTPSNHDGASKKCEQCGSSYTASRYKPKSKFCSAACRQRASARLSAPKRGDAQRGRGKGLTYTKRNGRHEHRVVAEEMLGRSLTSNDIVHHINHDKKDNRPENLSVMSRSEHAALHLHHRWHKDRKEDTCRFCI